MVVVDASIAVSKSVLIVMNRSAARATFEPNRAAVGVAILAMRGRAEYVPPYLNISGGAPLMAVISRRLPKASL